MWIYNKRKALWSIISKHLSPLYSKLKDQEFAASLVHPKLSFGSDF